MDSRIEIRPGRFINVTIHENFQNKGTIFLIHGLGGNSNQWRSQIPVLRDKYTLIIPDLLGHGKSDKPEVNNANPYSFKELTQDILVLFSRYATKQNIIIGHSYGGALSVALAMSYSDKINKLILIDPICCKPQLNSLAIYSLPVFILEIMRPWLEKYFQKLAFDKSTNQELISQEHQAGKSNKMYVIKAMINGMKEIPQINVSNLKTTTLIVIGGSDGLIPASKIQEFYTAIPNHQFYVISDASHMVMLEKPNQVNQIIADFLE